jgi:Icc-related predicted phosphoesterase
MEINICHFSDTHGKLKRGVSESWKNLPIDLVIASGDICPNNIRNFSQIGYIRHLDKDSEIEYQKEYIRKALKPWLKRKGWYNKTFIINGNHDFVSFDKHFVNACSTGSKTIEIEINGKKIKIGLIVGTNIIPVGGIDGGWYEEISESEFERRVYQIDSDVDIIISHRPPYGILDLGYGERIGSQHFTQAIFGSNFGPAPYFTNLKAVFFGHAHGGTGEQEEKIGERTIKFYNSAEKYNFVKIEI